LPHVTGSPGIISCLLLVSESPVIDHWIGYLAQRPLFSFIPLSSIVSVYPVSGWSHDWQQNGALLESFVYTIYHIHSSVLHFPWYTVACLVLVGVTLGILHSHIPLFSLDVIGCTVGIGTDSI
jgi:hypothetical protein